MDRWEHVDNWESVNDGEGVLIYAKRKYYEIGIKEGAKIITDASRNALGIEKFEYFQVLMPPGKGELK